jgi:hypothetical protein
MGGAPVRVVPHKVVLGVVGLVAGVLGVGALREATLSTHQRMPPDSRVEIVITAEDNQGEHDQSLLEMVHALVTACRLEVASDPVGDVEEVGEGRFRAVLTPALDETNRRQFRGCLEDWTIDHVQADLISVEELG